MTTSNNIQGHWIVMFYNVTEEAHDVFPYRRHEVDAVYTAVIINDGDIDSQDALDIAKNRYKGEWHEYTNIVIDYEAIESAEVPEGAVEHAEVSNVSTTI